MNARAKLEDRAMPISLLDAYRAEVINKAIAALQDRFEGLYDDDKPFTLVDAVNCLIDLKHREPS